MANLSLPPPARVAIGSVSVAGQRAELFLSPEWARYFDSLNTQVNTTASAVGQPGAPGTTGAAGAAVSFTGDSEGGVEFIPMPGPSGPAGAAGLPLFLLQPEPVAPDLLPMAPSSPNETFIAPTLLNLWVNYDITAFNPAGYFKDRDGIVHLRGLVKNGTVAAAIFNLPAGYRPLRTEIFSVIANNALGRVDVNAAGDVLLNTGSNLFASLDGITFRALGTY